MTSTPKIVTHYWAKPIPPRQFDWSATFDGYEPGDPCGYGATEIKAVEDLGEQLSDRGDEGGALAAYHKQIRLEQDSRDAAEREDDAAGLGWTAPQWWGYGR